MRIKYIFFFLLCLAWLDSAAQCNLNYEVKVSTSLELENTSKIILTLKGVTVPVKLKLYDIMDPRFPLIMERDVNPNTSKPVEFPNLKSSTYSIIATWESCSENIGGIKGIRIDKTQKK